MSRASALLLALSASLVEVTLAFNIAVARSPSCAVTHRRVATPKLEVADAVDVDKAAAAVKKAAAKFGKVQADKTNEWLSAVVASDDGCPTDGLLSEQLILFEECLLDDEGGKCKELDAALSDLEQHLMAAASTTPAEAFFAVFGKSKLDRACARVRTAATKFGPKHGDAAAAWVASVREKGAANPAGLLETQEAIFGECLLDEDGGPSRCLELQESLSALQASLGIHGKIISTRDLLPKEAVADN